MISSFKVRVLLRNAVSNLRFATVLALVALIVSGCRPLPRAPTVPRDDAAFAPPVAVEPPGLPDDPPTPYVMTPGDVVRLRIASVDPLDVPELMVDGMGRLHVPLAGDVVVGGLGISEAERRIEDELKVYDRLAHVSLLVTNPAGHRAIVIGAVAKPGVYELKPDARLAEVVALAGGFKVHEGDDEFHEMADLAGARLVRGGVTVAVSFGRALEGDPRHNVRLRPGDILYVPPERGGRVVILGEVQAPKAIPFRQGLRLTEVLARAGGTTKDADAADVRVVRGPLSRPKVYRADIKALIAGEAGDVVLAPGDIVFVTEHWFATAAEIVNRLTPALAVVGVAATLVHR